MHSIHVDLGGISGNLSSLTICHSLTSTVTFLILIGYEALSLTVAMVIVSEWQIVSDDKFHEIPPPPRYMDLQYNVLTAKMKILFVNF